MERNDLIYILTKSVEYINRKIGKCAEYIIGDMPPDDYTFLNDGLCYIIDMVSYEYFGCVIRTINKKILYYINNANGTMVNGTHYYSEWGIDRDVTSDIWYTHRLEALKKTIEKYGNKCESLEEI